MGQVGIRARKKKIARASFRIENKLYDQGYQCIAGIDEVGRGAWAGPVVAAACILPRDLHIGQMFDSKNVNKAQRAQLNAYIQSHAVTYGIGEASHAEVTRLGMTAALIRAYTRALEKLHIQPDMVLLDGLKLKKFTTPHIAVVNGDRKSKCIAAASIIAKEYRDALMVKLSPRYPEYGFQRHKGYGTEQHQQAILKHGILPIHRMNYGWLRDFKQGKQPRTVAARRYYRSLSLRKTSISTSNDEKALTV
jgi:ribonuclease HII